MPRAEEPPPPDIVQALETLEQASAPTELGPSYQALSRWRRHARNTRFRRPLLVLVLALTAMFATIYTLQLFHFTVTEFGQGVLFGALAMNMIALTIDALSPRPLPPPNFVERADNAIGRWRHLTPLMREIPK